MKQKAIYVVLLAYLIIAALTIVYFNGTGDAGDSVHHYLFAKYAPSHPKLFFDHWAKPVYVLLASAFAQFGFIGIKVFNVILTLGSIYTTFRIARHLKLSNAVSAAVIYIFAPLVFVLTFSGLTEPLFALFLSLGVLFAIKNKYLVACLIISFLPFIRSEGLIFLGVFAVYFFWNKQWKLIPQLLFGHLCYSIAGYFVYGDLLWVFKKIPYASLNSVYGEGGLFHYVEQLVYVVGIPIYFLIGIGIIGLLWKAFKRQINSELFILILGGFLAFFVAHTLFWYLGIFNSMGLKRVFVGVMPLMAILALIGLNTLTEPVVIRKKAIGRAIQLIIVIAVCVFPFTSNPAAVKPERDLLLSKDQLVANSMADYIQEEMGTEHRFIHMHPYLSQALDIDHFDTEKHMEMTTAILNELRPGDVLIWDSWFCVVERGISLEMLEKHPLLALVYTKELNDDNGNSQMVIFRYDKTD